MVPVRGIIRLLPLHHRLPPGDETNVIFTSIAGVSCRSHNFSLPD